MPGPTPYAGVPLEYAALVSPGPPVANTKSHFSINSTDFSMVAPATIWIRSAGAPFFSNASLIKFTVLVEVFSARGAGEMIMAFLPFNACMKLPRGVTVGFVAGVIAAIMPTGCATSMIPCSGISLMIPTDFLSFR